ncbi:hypothetical protein KJ780_01365 [Candidatus Micrarchaeota archaeon]|nr:hypothetical protein [Candidatus Micrarchaeota archaeon]
MAEKLAQLDKERWNPRTEIGRMVKSGEITSLEQISDMGKPILESGANLRRCPSRS